MQHKFREPTLFEFVLYDLGKYSSFDTKQKIITCMAFMKEPVDEKTEMSQVEDMIRSFDLHLKKGAKLLTLVRT